MTADDIDPVPPGYTREEWAEYQRDPAGYCARELSNPDASVRFNAADILRGLAAHAEPAIPALIRVIQGDPDPQVRRQAIFAFTDIGYSLGDRAISAVPVLLTALVDQDQESRCLAAMALGDIGVATPEVAEVLRTAQSDGDAEVREAASQAFQALGRASLRGPRSRTTRS